MRITIQDVKTDLGITETYDIVNAITNEDPATFSQYVPLANVDNVTQVGQALLMSTTLLNEFVNQLVNRIGRIVINQVVLRNPLKKFKKGAMPDGYTIEEVFTDITKGKKYDPEDAEQTLYKRTIPNVHTLFHERNRQDRYDATISQEQLKSAFLSWDRFGNFVASIIQAVYNSAEVEEYKYMKLLIDNYYSKGLFTVQKVVDPVDQASATEFVKALRTTATMMTLPMGSRDYNALAVHTVTDPQDLHLIIDAKVATEIDVDVLASAFNMDKASFIGSVTKVDNFASTGLKAILCDREWFMVFDNLYQMENVRNPKGLYWNYFLHVWQVLSVSRFQNAVAFVAGDVKPVTSVIVSPAITSLKQGKTLEFTAYVRATDGQTHDVVWSVVPNSSSDQITGSSIDQSGVLTVGVNQTGELRIKATSSFLDSTVKTTLTVDSAIGDTTLDVADTSLFTVGDLVFVGTETNPIEIASIDSATQITLTSGLVSAQVTGANVTKQDNVVGEAVITVVPTAN